MRYVYRNRCFNRRFHDCLIKGYIMSNIFVYRAKGDKDNGYCLRTEYFTKGFCISPVTGMPKKWLVYGGIRYKLETEAEYNERSGDYV